MPFLLKIDGASKIVTGGVSAVGGTAAGAGLCTSGVGCAIGAPLAGTSVVGGVGTAIAGKNQLFGDYNSQEGQKVIDSCNPNRKQELSQLSQDALGGAAAIAEAVLLGKVGGKLIQNETKVLPKGKTPDYQSQQYLDANEIRFSQNTVSFNKKDRLTGENYTYNDLVASMKKNGWKGDAVDVVKMPDGKVTSFDNTRISAARDAGIDVKASIHHPNDPLPTDMIKSGRFGEAKTWGEAISNRINNQKPKSFGSINPNGTLDQPKITGKPKT